MRYFKGKLKAISREYTKRDRDSVIAAAGGVCPMCDRKDGDIFIFGPTNYLKQQIKFYVRMDIHVIEGGGMGSKLVVICSGCHLSYHLFNRLGEEAVMGDKKLGETLYKRCAQCKELNCMCCNKCEKLMKWCSCSGRSSRAVKTARVTKAKSKKVVGAKRARGVGKRMKLRSRK